MTKSILALCFLFSLVFSILAPPVSDLLEFVYDQATFIDSAEEESQEEIVTSRDDTIMIIQSESSLTSYFIKEDNRVVKLSMDDSSNHLSRVQIPPPELNV